MRTITLTFILAILFPITTAAQDARFSFEDAASTANLLPLPEGVSVSWAAGALRVESVAGEISVPLVRVPMEGVETPYVYGARVKSEGLTAPAYLEMWSELDSGSYFSRALNESLTGDMDWRSSRTPFFLKSNDPRPKSVTLGVRMEGPGTLWIDDMTLKPLTENMALGAATGSVSAGWMRFWSFAGAAFGVIVGTWGSIVGYCAPRGKGRRALLGAGYGFLGLCVVLLVYGMWVATRHPLMQAYPALLVGILGLVILPYVIATARKQYRDAEMRRIQAMDVA